MTPEEFMQKYAELGHAIQSGVAFGPGYMADDAKHLRTGLNMVMSDAGSLGRLLVDKGICTMDEYYVYILGGLEAEVSKLEAELSAQTGMDIKLL